MHIFLAGATGVIGKPLVRLLIGGGHRVTGTTRSAAKAADLKAAGVTPAVIDIYDPDAVKAAVVAARPDVVIHQLTDLPDSSDPKAISASLEANARIRIEGTYNLIVAAKAAGTKRFIAQSIGFLYTGDQRPFAEDNPIKPAADVSARGVHALENAVTGTPGIDGIVLRYGKLYGPGTWNEKTGDRKPDGTGYVHVDAAAQAAMLTLARGSGIYNIAEDDGELSIAKARRELGFDPAFRIKA
jgi:nucleoside-diphosphate-sugar epimerase